MVRARYKFFRTSGLWNLTAFFSRNEASKDALKALSRWAQGKRERSYSILQAAEDFLVADLEFDEMDCDEGGDALEIACVRSGVDRNFLKILST